MGISIKNKPKAIESMETESGDIVVCDSGIVWIITDAGYAINLEDGETMCEDDLNIVKIYRKCVLTLG